MPLSHSPIESVSMSVQFQKIDHNTNRAEYMATLRSFRNITFAVPRPDALAELAKSHKVIGFREVFRGTHKDPGKSQDVRLIIHTNRRIHLPDQTAFLTAFRQAVQVRVTEEADE